MSRLVENNNELTEAEIKEYYELNEKEKQIMQEAFEQGIKETINDFLDEKYGNNSFRKEADLQARLYSNTMNAIKNLKSDGINIQKLVSSINVETETIGKVGKNNGMLDFAITSSYSSFKNPELDGLLKQLQKEGKINSEVIEKIKNCDDVEKEIYDDVISCAEIKWWGGPVFNKPEIPEGLKKDFKKLKDELIENPNVKACFLFFETHRNNEEFERTEAENAEKVFESLRDGKNITWVYAIRYSDFGKKMPFKSGIVKSNDKNIAEQFKQITI